MTHEELFHRWIEAVEKDQNWDLEQTRAPSAPVANRIPRRIPRYSTILLPAKVFKQFPDFQQFPEN